MSLIIPGAVKQQLREIDRHPENAVYGAATLETMRLVLTPLQSTASASAGNVTDSSLVELEPDGTTSIITLFARQRMR